MAGAMLLGMLLASTAGCDRVVPAGKAADGNVTTAAPKPKFWKRHGKAPAAQPSPTAHLVLLPDSAISVERGSTEEQLAAFFASKDQLAPRTFRFTGTEFEPWQSQPNPDTLRTMYAITQIMRAYPNSRITLIGHTDNDGTSAQNIALSRQRVDRMAALLVRGGIQPRRITKIGKGLSQPIADNGTAQGRARNRRIELIVTAK